LDASGQRAECSKTAGRRVDSCPTCPWISLIFCGLERLTLRPLTVVCTADALLPCTAWCAAVEPNTSENWYASTYWAPTMGTILSRFKRPHERCRPCGISLQNGRTQARLLPRLPREP